MRTVAIRCTTVVAALAAGGPITGNERTTSAATSFERKYSALIQVCELSEAQKQRIATIAEKWVRNL